MLKRGCNGRGIGVGGRPLLLGRPSSARSLGLFAMTSHVARHSGLTMPSLSCKRIIHSGFRFMRPHQAQGENVLRFQSRSCNPINAPNKIHSSSRLKNNDLKNDLKYTLLNAVFRSSNQATAAERFKDVIFCIRRFISWQCENQASHRLQKSFKYYSKCSKLWKDQSVMRILSTLRRMLLTRSHFLISAVGVYAYDWENNNISDDAIKRGARDMEILDELFKRTIICPKCGKRQVIDQKIATVTYCMCNGKLGYTDKSRTYDGWCPFIERDNVIVWRKPHEVHTHLFQFKVYGRYEDVSLSAFTESQLNTNFRTEWDFTALQLNILHSHKDSNSDLLYWLVKFPSFFANRDYLFKRRFHINNKSQEVTIVNEALGGNEVVPEVKGVVRVSEYWSVTVIRPLEKPSKPGIEYTLTYFDNPGTRLPQSVSNFIATTGFPNFLKQNHNAALTLQSRYENGEDAYVSLPYSLRYSNVENEVKTSEEQLSLEDEEHEASALQNVLKNKIVISDSNQIVTSAQIEYHKPCIQYPIEEKSDLIQNYASPTLTIDKVDELEITSHTKLTKEEELVTGKKEINVIPAKISVIDKETFIKEEMLDNEMKVMKDYLKETNKVSEYNENESISEDILEAPIRNIEQETVPKAIVEMKVMKDDLKEKDKALEYNENESIISEDISETSVINIEQEIVSDGIVENLIEPDEQTLSTEPKYSIYDNEYRNVFDESDKHSQRENDNIVQINKNESFPDMRIEVPIGSKKVVVDLLEAMEVISPELEEKTVLLKKVEDWAEAALKDIDNNTEFIQNVNKLCIKIEKFKERAKNKKIQSLRIMEEMEKQTNKENKLIPRKGFAHYDHSGGLDEKTKLTLEKFLLTMKEVVERDKDMRTGRGYSIDCYESLETTKQSILRETLSEASNIKTSAKDHRDEQYQEKIKHKITESPIKNEDIRIINENQKTIHVNKVRVNEFDIDNISEVKNESGMENQEDDPPKDPPAPIGTKPEVNHEMPNVEKISSVDTAQISNNVRSNVASENENNDSKSSTDSRIHHYAPDVSSFGGGNSRLLNEESVKSQCNKIEDESLHNINTQSSSWYTFGLDGYFNKTSEAQKSDSSICRKETENTNGCDNVDSNGTSWYWYPIIGMHKLIYSWVWNAGIKV